MRIDSFRGGRRRKQYKHNTVLRWCTRDICSTHAPGGHHLRWSVVFHGAPSVCRKRVRRAAVCRYIKTAVIVWCNRRRRCLCACIPVYILVSHIYIYLYEYMFIIQDVFSPSTSQSIFWQFKTISKLLHF